MERFIGKAHGSEILAMIEKKYRKSFEKNKHLITSFPTGQGTEHTSAHPFIKQILTKLLPRILPGMDNKFHIEHELPLAGFTETGKWNTRSQYKYQQHRESGLSTVQLF